MLKSTLLAMTLALPIAASSVEQLPNTVESGQPTLTNVRGYNCCWVFFMGMWWCYQC